LPEFSGIYRRRGIRRKATEERMVKTAMVMEIYFKAFLDIKP